jgi:hypothetical protein
MPNEHILSGLEPDNLLAVLALLGLHRALEHAHPDLQVRSWWAGTPPRPRLAARKEMTRAELLDAACRGCEALAEFHSFDGRKDIDYPQVEARGKLEQACKSGIRDKADVWSSLMSDAAAKDDKVRATPFCLMFGQGHQHFLERLETVPKGKPPKKAAGRLTTSDLNSPDKIELALFHLWQRTDPTDSFRWDPLEDRRYALRFRDPSPDAPLTVHGANRLASLGLPSLPAAPAQERGEIRLHAVGTTWESGRLFVRWPIWNRPASLQSIVAMLAICADGRRPPGLGILQIYSAERMNVGKLMTFSRAAPVAEQTTRR